MSGTAEIPEQRLREFDDLVEEFRDHVGHGSNIIGDKLERALRELFRDALTQAVEAERTKWQPIETAPKDGTVIDVWLGGDDMTESDIEFYCSPGTRRSANWKWRGGKFRPDAGLATLTTFVEPTHWMPLPTPPGAAT